ncbi:MAG TPA: glycosyltransferase [Candidatus Merdenecus merdavium]|nr:glycosyltransferase [Candidatus Merdenecus merdavium]
MKIIHVTTSLSIPNGVAKLLLYLIPYQKQAGHSVDIAILMDFDSSYKCNMQEIGCQVFPLKGEKLFRFNPLIILRLKKIICNYDIVHVHLFPSLYWVAFTKLLFPSNCKIIFTEHNFSNNRIGKKWLNHLEQFIYKRYNRIIAISEPVAEMLRTHTKSKGKIITVENGIDLSCFDIAVAISRKEMNIPDGAVLITQVARFMYEKDQRTVLRALALLPENYHVLLVGDGFLLEEHKQMAQQMAIAHRVHFLGLRIDVPSILKASDVVVVSSIIEGFGLVAVEGMAAGKPVVASDVPGLAEVVKGAGILFKVQDEKALAEHIYNLITNKSLYEQVSSHCLKRSRKYSIAYMAIKYESIYCDVCNVC